MPDEVKFCLSEQDRRNLHRVLERHPTWSPALIFRRALAVYANNLILPREARPSTPRSAQQDIEELFGPQV